MEILLEKSRTPITFFCIGVLFSVAIFWFYLERSSGLAAPDNAIEIHRTGDEPVRKTKFYISGAVEKPGHYEVPSDTDIRDYIESEVGIGEKADIGRYNDLISQASGSSIIFIPEISEVCSEQIVMGESTVESPNTNSRISLNNATQRELESLPGIGPVYAERIIQGRPYTSLTEVKKVKGIGDKTFEKINPYITL